MLNQLLRDSDVFGMANSLEIRVPLIDHKLVEAIFQIDENIILQGSPKALLLDALPTPLPRLCTHRPKMGFTFPFDAWMKGPWQQKIAAHFLSDTPSSLKTLIRPQALSPLWRRYQQGHLHWARPWTLHALSNL